MHRRLLSFLLTVLSLSVIGVGQTQNQNLPDCRLGFSFQVSANTIAAIKDDTGQTLAVGSSKVLDNRPGLAAYAGCNLWHLQYQVSSSSLSALSIEVDFANDNLGAPGSFSVWSASNVASGLLPLTAVTGLNKSASVYGSPDWLRVFLNSATGTGQVTGTLIGWRPQGTSDTTSGATPVNPATYQFKHISSNTNTQMKATAGSLHAITVNASAAGTVTIVDTSASNCTGGTVIGIETLVANGAGTQTPIIYDVAFVNGLCITTSASPDLTVSFK